MKSEDETFSSLALLPTSEHVLFCAKYHNHSRIFESSDYCGKGFPTAARNLYKVGLPFIECFKKERNLVGFYIPKYDCHGVRLN